MRYVLIYDSNSQVQLFRSAQDEVQTIQTQFRATLDKWMDRGQALSDVVADRMQLLFDERWFWLIVAIVVTGGAAWRHRKFLLMQALIIRLRRGTGSVNEAVIEEMFYRAARLAQRGGTARRPAQTWREWIFGLPDPRTRV